MVIYSVFYNMWSGSIMVEDRGSLDLTFQIESKDKEIADLKHDNKSLAKQVDDKTEEIKALKMKLEMLDNKS